MKGVEEYLKNDIKRLLVLIIVLVTISISVILINGRTYELNFDINNDNYYVTIEDENDSIEVVEKKEIGDQYFLRLKGKKYGKVNVFFHSENGLSTGTTLYVHKSKIITDNYYFGKCSGDIVIPISLSIVLIYSIYLLINKYRKNVKENLYQYRNVAYLGIIIFFCFYTFSNIIAIFNYNGLYGSIERMISLTGLFSTVLLPVAFVIFILVTVSNIKLIIREGMSLKNLLGLFLGIFICLSTILPDRIYLLLLKSQRFNVFNLNGPGPYIYNFIESLIYTMIAYLECILIGTIIIGIKSAKRKLEFNKDYMIILGCQIRKDGSLTPLLKNRVDKALEFRNKQLEATGKDLIFIASGGKGLDEVISEGEAIKNYLIEQGINKKNIILEDKSTNTYENIKYSNKLIKKKDAKVAFATTNYHVFRTGLLATSQGLLFEGIGGKTKAYFWINAFIREFIGTIYAERKKHIIMLVAIIIILILLICFTYLVNNI